MADVSIFDSLEFAGDWFMPDDPLKPPKRIQGNFKWEDRTGRLDLFDSFGSVDLTHQTLPVMKPDQAIHGETTTAKHVTLLRVLPSGSQITLAEAGFKSQQTFKSWQCVIGAHVDQDTLYSQIDYRIPGLLHWMGNKGASVTLSHEVRGEVSYTFNSQYREKFESTEAGFVVELGVRGNFPSPRHARIIIERHGVISLFPNKPLKLDGMLGEIGKLVSLVSMIAGAPMMPEAVNLKIADGREVNLLIALNSKSLCTFSSPSEFFILRESLGNNFTALLDKWLSIYDTIKSPAQLALSVFGSTNLWVHVEFLSLMQALEGLHRALLPDRFMDQVDYDKMLSALEASIPREITGALRDSLKAKLKYGNEFSLRRRLKDLVEPLPIAIRQLILLGNDQVPQMWIDTRNYYTHSLGGATTSVLSGAGMHRAGVRLKLLLRVLYLHQLGASEEMLITALKGTNEECQYLQQLFGEQSVANT